MPHRREQAIQHLVRVEVEHEMHAFHEVPGGQAIAQQRQHQQEQHGHHDPQAALQPCLDALTDDHSRQEHKDRVPQDQPPRVGNHRAEIRTDLIRRHALKIATSHVDDVIQRPAAHHAIEGENQQRGDHPGKSAPRPTRRMPRLDRQRFERIRRTEPRTTTNQRLGDHHRNADQRDARQKYQHKCAAAIGTDHVREFPDTAQPHGGAGGSQDEHPATCPATVDRNLVRRHY
ncbi:hypothetical protein ALP75_204682 [Pseudomonas syringae pv. actinidiae]|nr:hypothetical protein ALP75_204682 [Pseudomonas syringae pv. actinidiae]